MADEPNDSLGRMAWVDGLCDRYEATLQAGNRLSPTEFLTQDGIDSAGVSNELLAELTRLEQVYRDTSAEMNNANTVSVIKHEPRRLGKYELRRLLGSGGFGDVWVAFHPELDREVALKIPHKGILGNPDAVQRFYREAKAAAKLKHKNIVRVHNAGSDGSTHYIEAELVDGQTLREICPPNGMDIRRAVRIVADLADAVFYAHRNEIVHRDIKPGNVLMDKDDNPLLTDFGLASRRDASAITVEGTVLGTPIYMAPEQAAGRFGAALPACDQYGLGAMLYELLTGRPPFSGPTSVVLYHKLNTDPAEPCSIRADIPADVEKICLRAMERIPEKRYPDCEAMAVELRAWLAGSPVLKSRWSWRVMGLTVGGLIVVGLSVLAIVWLADRPTNENAERLNVKAIIVQEGRSDRNPNDVPMANDAGLSFLDSTAYLPFNENRKRLVLDYAQIHGQSPEAVVKWINSLAAGFVPIQVSDHPLANPPQWHCIAVKVTDPPEFRATFLTWNSTDELLLHDFLPKSGFRYSGGVALGPPGIPKTLRLWVKDPLEFFHWVVPPPNQIAMAEKQRKEGRKPLFSLPACGDAPHLMEVRYGPDGGLGEWRADFALAHYQLVGFEKSLTYDQEVRNAGQFLVDLRARKGGTEQLQFVGFSWENPDRRDWDFKADMTTAEYESELVRRKAEGFRPTTVTSYGDPANPKYAAAWIRYFYRPKQ